MKYRNGKRKLLLMVVMILFLWPLPEAYAAEEARMVEISGTVLITRAGGDKSFDAFENMRLAEGDRIFTGPRASARIKIGDSRLLVVAENTRILLSELKTEQTGISLEAGGMGSRVQDRITGSSRFQIRTPNAVMGIRGTEFFTRYHQGNTDLRVLSGAVEARVSLLPSDGSRSRTQTLLLEALQQKQFSPDMTPGALQQPPEDFSADGMEPALLRYLIQRSQEEPELLPQHLEERLEETLEDSLQELEQKLRDALDDEEPSDRLIILGIPATRTAPAEAAQDPESDPEPDPAPADETQAPPSSRPSRPSRPSGGSPTPSPPAEDPHNGRDPQPVEPTPSEPAPAPSDPAPAPSEPSDPAPAPSDPAPPTAPSAPAPPAPPDPL